MRRTTRSSRVAALVAVFAVLYAACGGDGGGGGGGGTATGGTTDISGQDLTVIGVWGQAATEAEEFAKILDSFNQKTGANAQYVSAGSADLVTFIGTRVQGGNPPDLALLPNPGLLRDFAQQGDLVPVEDVVGDIVDRYYAPEWRDLASFNGKLYGLYFKAANKSTFWYNTHVFDNAGVQPPTDWDGLLKTAQTVFDSGVKPFALDGGSGWPLTDWFENVYARSAGPDMYEQLTAHQIPWTDPSVKTALEHLADAWKPSWIAGGVSQALQNQFPDALDSVWANPPAAGMYLEGDFVGGIAQADAGAKPGVDADFFDFPSVDGSEPMVVGGGDVAVMFKDSPGAQELLRYLGTPQAAEIWARDGGFISPNKQVDLSVYPNEPARRAAEALVNAPTFLFDMSDLAPAAFGGTTGQGMYKGLQDFLANPKDISGVQQELEASAKQAYGGG
jgi:alpha-glucoside transport system substrate-binding protein